MAADHQPHRRWLGVRKEYESGRHRPIATPEARRQPLQTLPAITATNGGVTRTTEFLANGLAHVMTSTGDGPGSKERVEYYDAGDVNSFKRSLPSDVVSGEDTTGVKSHIDYPSIDQSIERGPRGVSTSTESDELGRPIHITSSGTDDLAPEERFGYDGNGRLVRHATNRARRWSKRATNTTLSIA